MLDFLCRVAVLRREIEGALDSVQSLDQDRILRSFLAVILATPSTSEAARKVYESEGIKIDTLADRVRHVVQSAFDGKRIVIFSGGGKVTDDQVLEQIQATYDAVEDARAAQTSFEDIAGKGAKQISFSQVDIETKNWFIKVSFHMHFSGG